MQNQDKYRAAQREYCHRNKEAIAARRQVRAAAAASRSIVRRDVEKHRAGRWPVLQPGSLAAIRGLPEVRIVLRAAPFRCAKRRSPRTVTAHG